MHNHVTCPECGARTLLQSARMDHCQNPSCGWYFYYRDAYLKGDTNREGYMPVEEDR